MPKRNWGMHMIAQKTSIRTCSQSSIHLLWWGNSQLNSKKLCSTAANKLLYACCLTECAWGHEEQGEMLSGQKEKPEHGLIPQYTAMNSSLQDTSLWIWCHFITDIFGACLACRSISLNIFITLLHTEPRLGLQITVKISIIDMCTAPLCSNSPDGDSLPFVADLLSKTLQVVISDFL